MNIRNDIFNILSGKYKNFHRAWLFALFLIFYFFLPIPVSAFSDNFDDTDISDWTIDDPWGFSYTFPNGNLSTSASITNPDAGTRYTRFIKNTDGVNPLFFSINMNGSGCTIGSGETCATRFYFQANASSNGSYIQIRDNVVTVANTAYVSKTLTETSLMKYEVTIIGTSSVKIEIKYPNNNTVFDSQTVGWTAGGKIVTTDRVILYNQVTRGGAGTFSNTAYFDDVVVSAVTPSASNSVSWDAENYIEGGTQTITWTVTDSIWGNLLPIKIRLYQNDVAYDVWSSCVLGICSDTSAMILQTQTGSTPLRLIGGSYKIDLIETGIFSDTVLASDSMRVLATIPSQMLVNSSIPSRVSTPVWHNVGYTYGTGQIRINVEHKRNGVWEMESTTQIASSPAYTPITVQDVGEYRFTLFDVFQGIKLVTKMAIANAVDLPIQINISHSALSIDKSVYYYRDIMQGYYAIDNNNWTNGNTPYIAIRNTSDQTISAIFKNILGTEQQNTFMLVVGDGHELASNKFRPGNNTIELHSFNTSSDRLLNLTYFDLLDTDVNGNKLRTSKYRYCPGDQVLILASVPLQGNLTIVNYKDMNKVIYSQTLNGTDQSIIFKTSVVGDYLIRLMDTSGKQLRSADFVVSTDCVAITPTPTPISGGDSSTVFTNVDNWVKLLGGGLNNQMRFFFAIIWIIICVAGTFIIFQNKDAALSMGFLPFAFFSYLTMTVPTAGVEYVPKWAMILFILLVALSFRVLR